MLEHEFPDTESCREDTQKLIAQKIKKGYKEVTDTNNIPEKKQMSEEEQAEFLFWDTISKANKWKRAHCSEYDIDEHIENITDILAKKNKQQLIQFERQLQINLHKLYTAQIAELSIILENKFKKKGDTIIFDDYVSEDGFIYFRCWLLLKGKEFFEDISQDINAFINGKYSFDIGDTWAEALLNVADDAYSEKHENKDGCEIADAVDAQGDVMHYDSLDRTMDRALIGGADLQKAYPELVSEIVAIR